MMEMMIAMVSSTLLFCYRIFRRRGKSYKDSYIYGLIHHGDTQNKHTASAHLAVLFCHSSIVIIHNYIELVLDVARDSNANARFYSMENSIKYRGRG